jgi:integrase
MFPINPDTVTIYFSEACKELGIDNLHLHDFRHEAITRIAEVTRDALELSAFSGHKDLKALKRYYNPKASDLAKKLN